ncbi:hypothetical protein PUNSTDRAFT_84229 [Punctularia strigosozonata HHB-11173 SS5]|uniref:uncharacterized protein n=1 Tax=Punctularia strigosozonata (strain HHB-11173) TaxID=741275 RepID=UPI0004417CD5|nr:uncharacterized protein PUNSTDRAFT_84229 [Punctularia strigosozonata HHB-11173 SS5]EIN10290.1 hypothetical protein PUNSTDRAFT_84229 [Punctularia strigosozonata HHB-11173 SS5]
MFEGLNGYSPMQSEAELATQTLNEESSLRFPSFSANDAVTLGLSLRKRFRTTSKHHKGVGMVISIQTIQGHTLFSCTVGDLGDVSGIGDVNMHAWSTLEGMINVVRQTGHSSFYVEKGMAAIGKTSSQLGIQNQYRVQGGAFPIWLENALCCPIAVVACYSGSSSEDHRIVVTALRDYLKKMRNPSPPPPGRPPMSMNTNFVPDHVPERESSEWIGDHASNGLSLRPNM